MDNIKHIVFDLDGTIIDSKLEILETYRQVLQEIHSPTVIDLNTINLGANINQVLKFIYGSNTEKINLAKQTFVKKYDTSSFEHTHLYPHVNDVLNTLKQKGISLYIATNKRFIPATKILEAKNIRHFFTDIMANEMQTNLTIDKVMMLKTLMKNNDFKDAYMIGDTEGDINSGKQNNLKTIAVSYGYQAIEELQLLKPDYIIHSFADILTIVDAK